MDFHERVRHEYLRLADAEPERMIVIDGVGTPDEVFSEIRGVLEERLPGALARGGLGAAPEGAVDDGSLERPIDEAEASTGERAPSQGRGSAPAESEGAARPMLSPLLGRQATLWPSGDEDSLL